ncbi:MAG: TetR/AcrR family transcriptional regulator [Rhizobiaceae bacterium]|nr:TetR/AcrR family transcriptional regulator [Rhizobiaceae bacterium]
MARTIAKDHSEKRKQILATAAKVFARDGYDRTSVDKVAQACAISKANIYHYYSSKDEILFAILDTYLRGLRDRICNMELQGLDSTERFKATVFEILLAYQGADNEHRIQTAGFSILPEDQQNTLRAYQRDLVQHLSQQISENAPDIFADSKRKLHATTMSVFGMLNWYYMWNGHADENARKEYADLVCAFTLSGVQGL